MITGILLIGLGFALGYRRIQKTGTAVQSLTRLPVMIEAVGRAVSIETEQWDALASSPILQILIINYYTHTHTSPPPIPHLRRFESLWTASLTSGSDQRGNSGCGTGWLLAGDGLLPLWHNRVFMVYVLLCWGVFPVLTLYSPRSIVWGLFFFFSPSSCYAVFFLSLSTCISLLIIPCMIVYVTNNKEP